MGFIFINLISNVTDNHDHEFKRGGISDRPIEREEKFVILAARDMQNLISHPITFNSDFHALLHSVKYQT